MFNTKIKLMTKTVFDLMMSFLKSSVLGSATDHPISVEKNPHCGHAVVAGGRGGGPAPARPREISIFGPRARRARGKFESLTPAPAGNFYLWPPRPRENFKFWPPRPPRPREILMAPAGVRAATLLNKFLEIFAILLLHSLII